MAGRIGARSNDAWIAALRGHGADDARVVDELSRYLHRVVHKAVRGQLDDADVTDVVHESLGRIVGVLASFRADSSFTTWAAAIALRVAFTEMRRRHARQRIFEGPDLLEAELRRRSTLDTLAPDEALARVDLRRALEQAIANRLTERQRLAIVAELRGIPTVELARRMGITTNALYKLTHDARRKLRRVLEADGFRAESLRPSMPKATPCS